MARTESAAGRTAGWTEAPAAGWTAARTEPDAGWTAGWAKAPAAESKVARTGPAADLTVAQNMPCRGCVVVRARRSVGCAVGRSGPAGSCTLATANVLSPPLSLDGTVNCNEFPTSRILTAWRAVASTGRTSTIVRTGSPTAGGTGVAACRWDPPVDNVVTRRSGTASRLLASADNAAVSGEPTAVLLLRLMTCAEPVFCRALTRLPPNCLAVEIGALVCCTMARTEPAAGCTVARTGPAAGWTIARTEHAAGWTVGRTEAPPTDSTAARTGPAAGVIVARREPAASWTAGRTATPAAGSTVARTGPAPGWTVGRTDPATGWTVGRTHPVVVI